MEINYSLTGLILTALGALVLTLNNILTGWHQRVYGQKWNKRYWWEGWRPFLKITHPDGRIERRIKWNHKTPVSWFLPPKYIWEIIGFLLILIGTILQIIGLFI